MTNPVTRRNVAPVLLVLVAVVIVASLIASMGPDEAPGSPALAGSRGLAAAAPTNSTRSNLTLNGGGSTSVKCSETGGSLAWDRSSSTAGTVTCLTATTTTTAPPATTTTTGGTTSSTAAPDTTTTVPGGGVTVGSGPSAMVFPEKPGLTVAESSLTPYAGPRSIESGTYAFQNCLVTGDTISLSPASTAVVSFHNCKFAGNGNQLLLGRGGKVTVTHSLFDGAQAGNEPALVIEGGGSVRFSEFVNDTDHIRLGSNSAADWNWIHNAAPRTAEGSAHADGIEVYYAGRDEAGAPATGPHVFVRNNHIDIGGGEGANSAVNVTNDFGPVDGVVIEGNTFLPGGGFSLYLRSDGYCGCGGNNKNVEVRNNRWFGVDPAKAIDGGGGTWGGYYGTLSWKPEVGITVWSGNTLRKPDGTVVTFTQGQVQP